MTGDSVDRSRGGIRAVGTHLADWLDRGLIMLILRNLILQITNSLKVLLDLRFYIVLNRSFGRVVLINDGRQACPERAKRFRRALFLDQLRSGCCQKLLLLINPGRLIC